MLKIQKASAGSGKTFTLTRQYLTLLLGQPRQNVPQAIAEVPYTLRRFDSKRHFDYPSPHGAILAITFTNKATEEMTQRIVKELVALTDRTRPSAHRQYLLDLFRNGAKVSGQDVSKVDDEALEREARHALRELLVTFNEFNVRTIDSFFQEIVQTFARELDLPPVPAVDVNDDRAVNAAVGAMFERLNTEVDAGLPDEERKQAERENRFLRSWLKSYLQSQIAENKASKLMVKDSRTWSDLVNALKAFRQETYKLNRAEIDNYFSQSSHLETFERCLNNYNNPLKAELQQKAKALTQYGAFQAINQTATGIITKWGNGEFDQIKDNPYNNKTLNKMLEKEEACYLKKNAKLWDSAVYPLVVEVLELGKQYHGLDAFVKVLKKYIYNAGLFSLFNHELARYNEERETILLSDTGDLLKEVIVGEEDAPFIYERMGQFINHYLIDEFQDTSRVQWKNLEPLVRESLSNGYPDLIIGDEKQSIYRFRNASPELLGKEVQEGFEGKAAVNVVGTKPEENTNWRSLRAIVSFNNSLFTPLAERADEAVGAAIPTGQAAATYSNLVQQIAPKHLGDDAQEGYVKIMMHKETDEPYDHLEAMAQEIDRQLCQGGYRPGDIAILVQKHTQGKEVTDYLMNYMQDPTRWHYKERPQVVSSDSLRLASSASVNLIISVLRLAAEPLKTQDRHEYARSGKVEEKDNPEWARASLVHRYELERHRVDAATGKNISESEALRNALNALSKEAADNPGASHTLDKVEENALRMSLMDCPTLSAMVERIIAEYLSEEDRTNDNAFICALQDEILDMTEDHEVSPAAFIHWWDTCGSNTKLNRPDAPDCITLMTIHHSKGLEFPCVHVPYVNTGWKTADVSRDIDWFPLNRADLAKKLGCAPENVPPRMPMTLVSEVSKVEEFAKQFYQNVMNKRIDTLNALYVAFTRAGRELCVYGVYPENLTNKDGKLAQQNVVCYLTQAIIDSTAPHPDKDKEPLTVALDPLKTDTDDGYTLVMGQPTTFVPEESSDDQELKTSPLGEYRARQRKDDQLFTLSDVSQLDRFDVKEPRCLGIFLHAVLAECQHPTDVPYAMRRVGYRFHVPDDLQEKYEAQLTHAMNDPRVYGWFNDTYRVMSERQIPDLGVDPLAAYEKALAEEAASGNDGEAQEEGQTQGDNLSPLSKRLPVANRRPDRVVWLNEEEVLVIDYKFGSSDDADSLKKYGRQLHRYVRVLRDHGLRAHTVSPLLWFPLEGKIIPV